MKRRFFFIMGLLTFLFASCSKKTDQPALAQSKFHPGQVWTFKTPAGQPEARIEVLKVEDGGQLGTIIHLAISGVRYGDGQTRIPHIPFSESAVETSVLALERESGPVGEFAQGYRLWREAYDSGKGGVFTISVAEAFEAVTSIARQSK
jgi:hypothetical protein